MLVLAQRFNLCYIVLMNKFLNKSCKNCAYYAKSNLKHIQQCSQKTNYPKLSNVGACLLKMQICNEKEPCKSHKGYFS